MADAPIIAYDNILTGPNYTMLLGVDEPSAPLSDAWTWDMSRPALPRADANGVLSFSVSLSSGLGYGVDSSGNYVSYGQIIPYGGVPDADILILGAARNNPSGKRFTGGSLQILADAVEVFSQTIYSPSNASTVYQMTPHTAPSTYTITISGLVADATVSLPELFIGKALAMPFLDYGLDAYPETYTSTTFKASTGREIRSRRFVRIEQTLKWSYIDSVKRNELRSFIESALENLQPFFFAAFPDTAPSDCYMGIHTGNNAPMPLGAAMYVTHFSIKFQEQL